MSLGPPEGIIVHSRLDTAIAKVRYHKFVIAKAVKRILTLTYLTLMQSCERGLL